MKKLKNPIILGLALLGLGYAVGRHLQPAEIEVREIVKEVEKIRRDVVVVEKKTTNKDGTIIEEKITTDKSHIETAKTSDKFRKETRRNDYQVGLGVLVSLSDVKPVYELQLHKRMLGPVLVGIKATNDGQVGALVSLEF